LKAIVVGSVAALTIGTAVVALPMTSASAATPPPVGTLGQPGGTAGCIQVTGSTNEGCTTGRALDGAGPVVVSPDGKNVYVGTTYDGGAVATLTRNSDGSLSQAAGTAGCISHTGAGGCDTDDTLAGITDMVLAGDKLYVADSNAHVTILARDPDTGVLSSDSCLQNGTVPPVPPTGCTAVNAIPAPSGLAVTPDGSVLFVTSYATTGNTGTLAVVTLTGDFPPPPQGGGCYQSGQAPPSDPSAPDPTACTAVYGLANPAGVDVSPDGKNVYVASLGTASNQGAVAVFNLSGSTLTQPSGTPANSEACISNNLTPCKTGRALVGATDLDVSPDGKTVYVAQRNPGGRGATFAGGGLVRLDRAADGTLSQPAGAAGCIVQNTSLGALAANCATGRGLLGAGAVLVSQDNKSVYTGAAALNKEVAAPAGATPSPGYQGSGSSAVAVFDRVVTEAATGPKIGDVTQGTGTRGCIAKTSAEGCGVARALDSPGSSVDALAIAPAGGEVYASGNLSNSVAVLERHQTDLVITTTAPNQPYVVGQNNTISLDVQNTGPTDATNVIVTDRIGSPGAVIDATPSQGSCSAPPVTCNLGAMKANATATIVVRVVLGAAGTAQNTATVYADQGDLATTDNTSKTDLLAAGPGLTVVSGSGQQAKLGELFPAPLRVALRDGSGQPVTGVQVTFTAPATSPSALFASSRTETVTTDGAGLATSTTPRADNQPGSYSVVASAPFVTSVAFALSNVITLASPSPSDTATATISPTASPSQARLFLSLTSPSTITPGTPSTWRGSGRPGDSVTLRCYSRTPQNSAPGSAPPTYFDARRATLSSTGSVTFSLNPGTNTRCFMKYTGRADSDATTSVSIAQNVATALSLSAYRDGVRRYHFQGTNLPRRAGQLITLYRYATGPRLDQYCVPSFESYTRTSNSSCVAVRTATAYTNSSNVWRIDRTFTGSGLFFFVARTRETLTNAAGFSNQRRTIIH
jgi:uncharacterized repeat protein (TIGR01451 family)